MITAGGDHPPVASDRPVDPEPDGTERYLPALDGLRALAVVAAMLFHAEVLRGGFLGVDLFFVVSGYLITRLLLDDASASGRVRLGRFWGRRARRLGPALLVVLGVTLVWAYLAAPASLARTTARQLGWSLVYLNNWFALFGDVGYWGAEAAKGPLNHLWSLAIEEQFYVMWPLVVAGALALNRGRRVLIAIAGAGTIASGVWQAWIAGQNGTDRAYLGTDTRAVALLAGCLLALLLPATATVEGAPATPSGDRRGGRAWDVAVVLCGGWLTISWVVADLADGSLYRGWLQSCSVAAGIVVAAVVTRGSAWYSRALASTPLVWIGKRSYSLYLWHWPIWVMLTPAAVGWSGTALWALRIAITVVAATASYAWLEQPIREGRIRAGRLLPMGGLAVAGLAVSVLAFPPALPPALRDDATILGGSGASGGAGGLQVLVAGDSWGRNMGFALALADPDRRHTFINLGVGGCGLMTGMQRSCTERQQQGWADVLASRRPDAALLVTGTVDQGIGATIDGKVTLPCDPPWNAAYARRLDEALDVLRGPDRIPVYLTTVRTALKRPEGSACMNQLLRDAASRKGATVLDLHEQLCPGGRCLTTHDGKPLYDETGHLAPAGQRWVGRWIIDVLEREVQPRSPGNGSGPPGPCGAAAGGGAALPLSGYTSSPDASYPDTTRLELTDGRHGSPSISDPAWQGWREGAADVVVKLDAPAPICSVVSTWLQDLDTAVQPPALVEVYVAAEEGQPGTRLGATSAGRLTVADQPLTIRVDGTTPIPGRIVIIRVRAVAEWSFVDEITVFGPPR